MTKALVAFLAFAGYIGVRGGQVFHAYPQDGPTSFCDCVRNATQPGDECRLHAGRYYVGPNRCVHIGAHGTADAPIVISSAGDGEVVIDGTVAIEGPWMLTVDGKHYAADAGNADILQLFANGDLQVLARHPNAAWSDGSVFHAVENWFRSQSPGVHDVKTGLGVLNDTGACPSPSDCCARCNSHDLAASGINATGALAIVNLWSCDTGVQRVTRHDASAPEILYYNATWDGLCDTYRGGDGRYYLEGLSGFLDTQDEWLFDRSTKHVLRAAKPFPGVEYRGRVSDYALVVDNASFLRIANISFFASTISVAGNVSDVTLASLVFNYSSVSRRALGDTSPPVTLALARDKTLKPAGPANFTVEDLIVRYSDGPALLESGDAAVIQDSLFEWNDWTGVGGAWPLGVAREGKAQRATTLRTAGQGLVFRRLTMRNNGAAQAFNGGSNSGDPALVELCFFSEQFALQDDGSFVEGGGSNRSTIYVQNWGSSTGKSGLRWDGDYPTTNGGLMFRNVMWNTSAVVIKGDHHNISLNTIFDGADIEASHAAHDTPRYQDDSSPLDSLALSSANVGIGQEKYNPDSNKHTVFIRNIFDAVEAMGSTRGCSTIPCQPPGSYSDNLIGTDTPFDIRAELRDPYHWDFRPCPGSQAANLSAGAYSPRQKEAGPYWIPGRRERRVASTPVPPSSSAGVYLDTDLIWLPAVRSRGHAVFLGPVGGALSKIADIEGSGLNVVRLSAPLKANTDYEWRVDTLQDDSVAGSVPGPTWTFTTGNKLSCSRKPEPPKPLPQGCKAAEDSSCPGLKGQGMQCEDCVKRNDGPLVRAGCFEHGTRHAFIQSFCYGNGTASALQWVPRASTNKPRFSGMFVALTNTTSLWSQEQWDTDCKSMKAAKFDFLVVPHTGRQTAPASASCPHGRFEVYYPAPDFNGTGACYEQVGDLDAEGGTLGNVLRAARAAELSGGVHLGLMFAPSEHGFPQQTNGSFADWGGYQASVAAHLHTLFGSEMTGVYTEIEFSNAEYWISAMTAFGRDYLGGIARGVAALPVPEGSIQVWASPYSIGNETRHPSGFVRPVAYAQAMRAAIDAAGGPNLFHHVAMQDSMGAQGNSFQNASDFLGNMSALVRSWSNVELFEVWPRDCQWPDPCHGRHPAPWTRIVQQMANEAAQLGGAESATLIAWEWYSCHFFARAAHRQRRSHVLTTPSFAHRYSCFSPNAGGDPAHPFPAEAKANYDAYMAYLGQK